MNTLKRIYNVVSRINEFNIEKAVPVALVVFSPIIIIGMLFKEAYDRYEQYRHRDETKAKEEEEKMRLQFESGQLRLRDMPYEPHIENNRISFEKVEHSRYSRHTLLYVATADDTSIRKFLDNESEWVTSWAQWYGFEVVRLDDQDQLLNQMCFPQERVHLKHGFLRDLNCWTRDRIYPCNVMPFRYYPLEEGTAASLKEQMETLAQDLYEEEP